jgi:signal transduction histidine kinase
MRIFFALMVLLLVSHFSVSSQDIDQDIKWFDSLFNNNRATKLTEVQKKSLSKERIKAIENFDSKGEARLMIEEGVREFIYTKEYGKAMDWLMQAYTLEDSMKLPREEFFTCIAIARVFEEVENFDKSLQYLNQSMKFAEEGNSRMTIFILNERGQVHSHQGDWDSAFEDYEQMLQNARQIESKELEADALYNQGELSKIKKEYDPALERHKQALALRRATGERSKEAQSLNAIGVIYLLKNEPDRSLANHLVAIKIRSGLKDQQGLAESYNNAGELYIFKNDFGRAIENLNLALTNSQESQNYEQALKAHDKLAYCYKQKSDFKKALYHKEEFIRYSDLLQREKADRDLLEIQNKHLMEQKESEIDQLESINEERQQKLDAQEKLKQRLYLLIGAGAIIVLLVLFMYLQKRVTNRKLKTINETKDKLFSIIGHDLKAPLNSLTAFSSLLIHHAETLTKEEIKMLSGDVDKSLKNLFALLENLLEWARSQTGNIDFRPVSFDLAAILKENRELLSPLAQKKNITIQNEDGAKLPVYAHRHSINTVVRNLISNAIKFTPTGGKIVVTTELEGKLLKVVVTDTGVGMSKEAIKSLFKLGTKQSTLGTLQEKGTGLGLILCKDFVEKNGGTIGVESEEGKGSKFFFTVPVGILEEKTEQVA